jgi:hypothetical protein
LGELRLKLKYFHSLTYRQFSNLLQGVRRRDEAMSQERLIIMRKLMYASLMPHLKKGFKETDIISFEFETETIQKLTETDALEMEQEVEEVKRFWAEQDAKQNIKNG